MKEQAISASHLLWERMTYILSQISAILSIRQKEILSLPWIFLL
jgi:hypothetical protein